MQKLFKNFMKSNPTYRKDNASQSSGAYTSNGKLVEYSKIN